MDSHKTPHQLIESQVGKWELAGKEAESFCKDNFKPMIAISRLPGCNTVDIVQQVSCRLGFDLFNGKLVELVAQDAHLSQAVAESLDEKQVSDIDD